jgi:hypothetical protein
MRYVAALAVIAAALIGCEESTPTAPPAAEARLDIFAQEERSEALPFEGPVAMPASLGIDVAQLLPVPLQLQTPTRCGDVAVYDEEDLATLCSPATLAATPIVSPHCPQLVSGSVRLETDLFCTDTDGLVVVGDNTVIDLNGHRIVCTGAGYFGSCQGPGPFIDDFGIDTRGRDNVHIFSHVPGGTIDGFDVGVFVRAIGIDVSANVKVKQVIVTGPAGAPGMIRPPSAGILVLRTECEDGTVRIGGGTATGNDVSHHTRGIDIQNASCVYVGYNRVHDNREHAPGLGAFGIRVTGPDNHIRSNVVTDNGDGVPIEAGIALQQTTNTLVVENQSNDNVGNGIETIFAAQDNYIVNNQMLRNRNVDAFSSPASVNRWNENNRCLTQTTPQPPPGVCGPDEAPPPQ